MKLPRNTIRRLSHYLRCLDILDLKGVQLVKSRELACMCRVSDSLVRRDLSYFGDFGKKGVGYNLPELRERILQIMGLNKVRKVVLCGVGNIGTALLRYPFKERNFEIIAAFDTDPKKIGMVINGIRVYPAEKTSELTRELGVEIGIIAVPPEAAQKTADLLAEGGIEGILSFALIPIEPKKDVVIQYVEIATELEILSFEIEERKRRR